MGIFGKTYDPWQWEESEENQATFFGAAALDPGTAGLYGIYRQYQQASEGDKISAPELTEQEKRIIAQMKEIAMGDPELSQLYVQNIQKAFQGTDIPLGLQKDIEEMQLQSQEAIARRLGAVGDIRSTPGLKSAEKTRRQALGLREGARQEAIRQAEGLMTSQQARQIGAAQVALSPLTHSGSLESRAVQQSALNQAQRQAGMMNLAGTIAGSFGGRRQAGSTNTGLTNTGTNYTSTESSPELYDYYSQGTGSF